MEDMWHVHGLLTIVEHVHPMRTRRFFYCLALIALVPLFTWLTFPHKIPSTNNRNEDQNASQHLFSSVFKHFQGFRMSGMFKSKGKVVITCYRRGNWLKVKLLSQSLSGTAN